MALDRISSLRARPRRRRPAGAPPGPRRRDMRRDALLDAAAALFTAEGSSATTIDDIAARAGVAKGTFYHYFADRAAMLDALRDRYCGQFLERLERAGAALPADALEARLDQWVHVMIDNYLATYALHDVLFHEPAATHRHAMGEEPFIRYLAGLIGEGVEAGIWAVDDPLAVAVVMFHAIHGAVDEAIITGSDTSVTAPRMARLCRNMVRAD